MSTNAKAKSTRLNAVQTHLLKMFAHTSSRKNLLEIKELLSKYYGSLAKKETNALWESRGLTDSDMDEILLTHNRTTYNQ